MKNLHKLIYYIILLIFFLGCNKKKYPEILNKYKLSVGKQIKIPIKEDEYDISYLSIVKEFNDTTYIYRKSRYSTSIYVYNWDEKIRETKIDFKEFGPNRITNFAQGAILPLTKKTFFIGTINNIYETFNDSVTYHSVSIEDNVNKKKDAYDNTEMYFIASQNHFKPLKIKNNIYCRLGATNGNLGSDEFYNSKILMSYNINTKKYKKLNFKYPYFYFDNCWGPSRTRYSMTLNNKKEFICLFPIKPRIYKYNLSTETVIDSIDFKSKYASSDLKPINCKSSSKKKMVHTFSNAMFRAIQYDKFRDVYYVFITLPLTKEKYDSVKNPFTLNPFSIMVLDKDFKVLTEQKFKGGIYHTSDFFVTKEGLWLSKNSPHNPEYNENELHFSLLTLEENVN